MSHLVIWGAHLEPHDVSTMPVDVLGRLRLILNGEHLRLHPTWDASIDDTDVRNLLTECTATEGKAHAKEEEEEEEDLLHLAGLARGVGDTEENEVHPREELFQMRYGECEDVPPLEGAPPAAKRRRVAEQEDKDKTAEKEEMQAQPATTTTTTTTTHILPPKPFRPGFPIPSHLVTPAMQTEQIVMVRTARYTAKEGAQAEFRLRLNQSHNSAFGFLHTEHRYYPYYSWLRDVAIPQDVKVDLVAAETDEPVVTYASSSSSDEDEAPFDKKPDKAVVQVMKYLAPILNRFGPAHEEVLHTYAGPRRLYHFLSKEDPAHAFWLWQRQQRKDK